MKIDITKYYGNRELFFVGELTSKIIHSMQTDGEAYLYTKESRNARENGLIDLLDELCAFWNWDKTKITIDTSAFYYWSWTGINIPEDYNEKSAPPDSLKTNNIYQDPNGYRVKFTEYSHPAAYFNSAIERQPVLPWNGEKSYGMFIGRASASRIYALQKHFEFKHRDQGLTSFHTDLKEYNLESELVTYFCNSGKTYKDVLDLPTPYSDIGPLMTSPIKPTDDKGTDWSKIYERIGIEVVCEVCTSEDCFDISEKLLRPLYFKRPFLLISSKWSLEIFRRLGFKTFHDIFNEGYDQLGEYNFARVNEVFRLLDELISDMTLEVLLDRCHDILEHNHRTVVNWSTKHRNFNYQQYIDKK